MPVEHPIAFISYARESELHTDWVRHLAESLSKNGVKVILDQWDLQPGDDVGKFMEQSLDCAKYIILVCTESFADKANDRRGGVGYEQAVFVGQILTTGETNAHFLPILRSGEPSKSIPRYLRSRLFIDFRNDNSFENSLEQLSRAIFGVPKFRPPLRFSAALSSCLSLSSASRLALRRFPR
jgi:TIR domain